MKLEKYMETNKITDEEVAKAVGVTRTSINRYKSGSRRPLYDTLINFYRWSGRKVTPNDFYLPANDDEEDDKA